MFPVKDSKLCYSILMANGMTTDVYHRDNCVAPDIAFIVWTTNTKSARARARVTLRRDGRMIDLRLPSGSSGAHARFPPLSPPSSLPSNLVAGSSQGVTREGSNSYVTSLCNVPVRVRNAQPRCRTWQWSRHTEPYRC